MMHHTSGSKRWTIISLLILAAGCATAPTGPAPKSPAEAIFYPPPPDAPRLQFLTSFSNIDPWVERKVQRSTFADFIAGTPKKPEKVTALVSPYGMAAHDGKLYICDLGLNRVHVINLRSRRYAVLGNPEILDRPTNITIDTDGTKYVCDVGRRSIVVFGPDDRFVTQLGDPKETTPSDVAIRGDELFVADVRGGQIDVLSRDGRLLRSISSRGRGPEQLLGPTNLDIGPDGNIYVSDTAEGFVKVFRPEGHLLRLIGEPGDRPGHFARPKGISIDPHGHIFVADAQWENIQAFDAEGHLLVYFGKASRGPEGTGMPAGLAIDSTSLEDFRRFVSPDFEPEYLLFVVNQFGINKIGIYAYGRSKGLGPDAYKLRAFKKKAPGETSQEAGGTAEPQ